MTNQHSEPVTVEVVRTGGFAGLRRQWRAVPPEGSAAHLVELIERCPWDRQVDASSPAPDRFVWQITVAVGTDRRDARLPETELHGPWRALVSEVQAFDTGR